MFTGIIKDTAKIQEKKRSSDGIKMTLNGSEIFEEAEKGESISVNGTCLTVEKTIEDSAEFYVMDETLDKTSFSDLEKGSLVNIEPALRPTDKMGGHIVQGHVESTSEIIHIDKGEESWTIRFSLPQKLSPYIVRKGFIAVEGISLTVTETEESWFEVDLIPETIKATNISEKRRGSAVNLETDITARYIEKMV